MRDTSNSNSAGANIRVLAFKRGYSRLEAASYVGLSPSKFDQLVADGRMPPAKQIDGRKVWDIQELDPAFEALGSVDTSWDDLNES